jgi:hypothetical protein
MDEKAVMAEAGRHLTSVSVPGLSQRIGDYESLPVATLKVNWIAPPSAAPVLSWG